MSVKEINDTQQRDLRSHRQLRGRELHWLNQEFLEALPPQLLRYRPLALRAYRLNIDQLVSVKVQKGRIVIEPMAKQEYPLVELLSGITAKNLHGEADFGGPVGKELL